MYMTHIWESENNCRVSFLPPLVLWISGFEHRLLSGLHDFCISIYCILNMPLPSNWYPLFHYILLPYFHGVYPCTVLFTYLKSRKCKWWKVYLFFQDWLNLLMLLSLYLCLPVNELMCMQVICIILLLWSFTDLEICFTELLEFFKYDCIG